MKLHEIGTLCFEILYSIFYVLFGVYAIVRILRSKKSFTTTHTTLYTSATMSRYFFYFLPVHCFARLGEIILRSTFFESFNIETVQLAFSAFPAFTFQIVLFLYLQVWQLQEHELSYQTEHKPFLEVRKLHVFLWLLGYTIMIALDFTLIKYTVENDMYASYVYMNSNFVIISFAFFYLGNKMHTAVSLLYGAADAGTFESHIFRVKWLFGMSCLVRPVYNMSKIWYPILQTNEFVFNASTFIVEVIPLAAALLSMAIVERRMNAMHPALVQ